MSGSNKLALQVAEKFRKVTGTAYCPTCSCHKPLDQFSRPKLPGKPRRCDSCHADAKARRLASRLQ
jgi:hypothetical protein